jgi:hypothetical protein
MSFRADLAKFLITSKTSDGRRQGATTEAYTIIRRKEERAKATPLELCEIPPGRGDDVLMVIRTLLRFPVP